MEPTAMVTVWHLAMDAPERLVPAAPSDAAIGTEDDPAVNRALYEDIGADHAWVDRRGRDERWWADELRGSTTLIARIEGEPAAYAELEPAGDGTVAIQGFGVRRAYRGRGVGGHLLTAAVCRAWDLGACRVTVSTCSLDDPAALPSYRRRGFVVVRTVRERRRTLAGS
jgi:GNAT superfamily N-acetyltransferase